MNNSELSYTTAPAFLNKLWSLVEDPSTDELICWDLSGQSFHVFDQARFAREILPLYFKHRNIASFIRQLNMYGFKKVVNVEVSNVKIEADDLEFAHQYFVRYQEHLLENIKRKISGGIRQSENVPSLPGNNILKIINEVKSLKVKQDNMAEKFDSIKLENDVLWREVVNLRQQNIKQQEILNKMIQFLMSLVNQDRPSIKRKIPLMINSAHEPTSSIHSTNSFDPPPAKIVRKASFLRPPIKIVLQPQKRASPLEPLAVVDPIIESAQLSDCIDDKDIESLLQTVDNRSTTSSSNLNTPNFNLSNPLLSAFSPPPAYVVEEIHSPSNSDSANNPKNLTLVSKQDSFLPEKEDLVQNLEILQNGIDSLRQLFSSGQCSIDANTLFELFGSEGPSVANSNLMLNLGEDAYANKKDLQTLSSINSIPPRGNNLMALSAPPNDIDDTSLAHDIPSFMDLPDSGDFLLDGSLISDLDKVKDDKINGDLSVEDFVLEPTELYDFLDYDSII